MATVRLMSIEAAGFVKGEGCLAGDRCLLSQ